MNDFSTRLKSLRTERGLSQKALGEFCGLSERGIQNYELDLRQPNLAALLALSQFFECSIDYLVGKSETK